MGARKLVVLGTGGLGRETLWSLRRAAAAGDGDPEVLGFLTNEAAEHGSQVCGLPVLGGDEWVVGRPDVAAVCAIGDPRSRLAAVRALAARGVELASAIDPSVERSDHVELGVGCLVGARAVLTTQVSVGRHVVIGVGAIVSHDAVLEDFATLAPGVVLAGGVHVERGAELGAGATVIPGRRIGRGALVGAQAAVTADVPPNSVVAGVPARPLRRLPEASWL